jgi:acetylornithine deacetylase/succinyl-diaminopimelate desuccinylase-like protein
MLHTTQAVDIFHAGVKINALPETASAIINHRIAEHRYVCVYYSLILWVVQTIVKLRQRRAGAHYEGCTSSC